MALSDADVQKQVRFKEFEEVKGIVKKVQEMKIFKVF
jgi:hypothetical protein